MAHRVGVCGSCRARFQIPATFLPNRARCRACGGVVEIGPAQGSPEEISKPAPARAEPPLSQPPPAPAARAAEAPVAAPAPEKKRNLLVPALVAAGVLALLVFGAFQLFGKSDRPSTAQAPAAGDDPGAAQPKPDETPAPR